MKFVEIVSQMHMAYRHKKYEKASLAMQGMSIHNAFHCMLVPVIRLIRKLRKIDLIIIGNKQSIHKNKSVIYACTHIGGFDIESLFEAIRVPCWLFLADPKEIYLNFDGIMLWLNGVICFESNDKQDRGIAKERARELLESKGSLMIFPEGAWNIYESLPVMPLFWGTADLAIQANVPIVPIAIERYEEKYYVNIGEAIEEHIQMNIDKKVLTQKLRDCLATLKWEIWESKGIHKRAQLEDTKDSFLEQMFDEKNTSVTIEEVLRCRYYPKNSEL